RQRCSAVRDDRSPGTLGSGGRYAGVRWQRARRAAVAARRLSLRVARRFRARSRSRRAILRRVAARGPGSRGPGGRRVGASRVGRVARSLVAVRPRGRGVRGRMGLAPPAGLAVSVWERLKNVFARRDPNARADAERILLEADFGPAAADEILGAIAGTPVDQLSQTLERA